jgi:hypothetical protein
MSKNRLVKNQTYFILNLSVVLILCSSYKHRQKGGESQQKNCEAVEKTGETTGKESEALG